MLTLPVNWCVFANKLPNLVEPVTNSCDEVIVCTTIVWAVKVPATVKLFAYDDVAANDALNTDIDDVCEVSTYGANIDDVALVSTYSGARDAVAANDELTAFNTKDAVCAFATNDAVNALVAHDAVPNNDPVILPETFNEPVIDCEPLLVNNCCHPVDSYAHTPSVAAEPVS